MALTVMNLIWRQLSKKCTCQFYAPLLPPGRWGMQSQIPHYEVKISCQIPIPIPHGRFDNISRMTSNLVASQLQPFMIIMARALTGWANRTLQH